MCSKPDYQREGVELYCADCRDVLPVECDAVVTDPPYGIDLNSHGQIFKGAKRIEGDKNLEVAELVRQWASQQSITCCMFFSPYRPMEGWRNVLCWDKGAHVGIGGDRKTCWKRDFELIGVEGNGVLNGERDSGVINNIRALLPPPHGHVAEKPVRLLEYLVWKLTKAADVVTDPFMGTGTTGVACIIKHRQFIGIEKDSGYFDIAVKRIEQAFDGIEPKEQEQGQGPYLRIRHRLGMSEQSLARCTLRGRTLLLFLRPPCPLVE